MGTSSWLVDRAQRRLTNAPGACRGLPVADRVGRLRAMVLGPQQMPPQGARALVGALLGRRGGGAEVSATLDEADGGGAVLEFLNEGTEPAVDLRYVVGESSGAVGTLPPGATVRVTLRDHVSDPFACVWICEDGRGGATAWSYAGRRKRFRRGKVPPDADLLSIMYR